MLFVFTVIAVLIYDKLRNIPFQAPIPDFSMGTGLLWDFTNL